jgi:hypothetical protein
VLCRLACGVVAVEQPSGSAWLAVLLAVLGSSAVRAIAGGYLTTRMRGRIEREEAWRTPLVTAADDLNLHLAQALWTLGQLFPSLPVTDSNSVAASWR